MDILDEWNKRLQDYFQKFSKNQFSLKYQNSFLTQTGDIVLKSIKQEDNSKVKFEVNDLITESKKWNLVLNECQYINNSVSLFLNREIAYRILITQIIKNGLVPVYKNQQICLICDVATDEDLSMTDFRIRAVFKVVSNILEFNGYQILDSSSLNKTVPQIVVGKTRSMKLGDVTYLICSPVITNGMTANDYLRKRSNDMQLIAQHKYGIRVKDQQRFQASIASLGRSAAIVDMLESKANSQINMKQEKNKSSKGAAFILYNYARLSVLFKNFAEKQHNKYYPPSPPATDVDYSLLTEEDEWHLFWVYVAGFPAIIQQASGGGQLTRIAPHLVLNFACGLVISLSKYYRRIRILTENRDHLLPVMFARIYLLKSVHKVLSTLLDLMDLEPITEM
ncbi:DALR anticodon-binding domain-containing protein 3 [Wyeomyia smithii]|uniref:DALR anticodon-binding domain-containing protein 3 n=1 Tax=Wyeomyia smithii TaxID=174621 RepID=UPI00246803AC|nr:DALR anticodon-binding domain-containing protein 3 [Wyeomyia smithii]